MKNNKIRVYIGAGWFTERTRDILDHLEVQLGGYDNLSVYSPRRDGIMLPPDQKHDSALRESIFQENIRSIKNSDIVLANIDSMDDYNDPGTIYEVGYAMASGVPVIGFDLSNNIKSRFGSILNGFECIISSYEELDELIRSGDIRKFVYEKKEDPQKVLFVGAGNKEINQKLIAHIMESGANVRWIESVAYPTVYPKIDEIFDGVKYMIAVIDDRETLVSWMIGQAYARNIPVVTYSDFNYGVNIMLLCSLVTHLRGTEELTEFLQKVKREGLESIPKFDHSTMNAM